MENNNFINDEIQKELRMDLVNRHSDYVIRKECDTLYEMCKPILEYIRQVCSNGSEISIRIDDEGIRVHEEIIRINSSIKEDEPSKVEKGRTFVTIRPHTY